MSLKPSKRNASVRIPSAYGSLTDVGSVRGHNEDSIAAESPLFVVADGMGGHEAGEVASRIAIETICSMVPTSCDASALSQAVVAANRAVLEGARNGTGRPGMGTTCTAAVVYDDEIAVAQVGDSRAYLLHAGALQRITRDHSLVADLVEQGRITEEQARVHPQRSVITRALGSDPEMLPDTFKLRVEEGDRLLLCSDGLTSMVEDKGIEAILARAADPQECCKELVAEALAAGGLDNISVIVVDPLAEDGAAPIEDAAAFGRTYEGSFDDASRAYGASAAQDDGIPSSRTGLGVAEAVVRDPAQNASRSDARASFPAGARTATPRTRHAVPKAGIIAFLLIIVVAVAAFAGVVYSSYFVGITEGGTIAVYHGLPGELGGLRASWVEEESDLSASELERIEATYQHLQEGIAVESIDAGKALIEEYRQKIEVLKDVPTSDELDQQAAEEAAEQEQKKAEQQQKKAAKQAAKNASKKDVSSSGSNSSSKG